MTSTTFKPAAKLLILGCALSFAVGCSSSGYGFRWIGRFWRPCVPCCDYPVFVYPPVTGCHIDSEPDLDLPDESE